MPSDGRSQNNSGSPGPVTDGAGSLAVAATFTAEGLAPALNFWIRELALPFTLRFAPYHQVFQQLLDPAGLLARNAGGINIVLVRFEDWGAGAERHAEKLAEAVSHSGAPLILAVCPPTPGNAAESERGAEALERAVERLPSVHVLTPGEIGRLYPAPDPLDPHADELGHVPYTDLYFAALGTALARKIHAIRAAGYKVIALDCDDTLWQGICGEDGPEGVVIDEPRRALQEFMREQRDAGMLLALCSKNNEEDVAETFHAHPEAPLRLEHFVASRINWDSKGTNLAALAGELQLGLDSFILVDDNPKECTEAQSACPEVLTLPLPNDPAAIPEFLRHVWAFDRTRITAEDRQRSALYAQQVERTRMERSSASLEDFIRSLQLEVRIGPMAPERAARVAQLTQRTNQMNTTCVQRTESELLQPGEARILTVEVSDRFGSYGLTGAAIYRIEPAGLRVEAFLLSCRVLGRGVEHRLLACLGEIAMKRGLDRIGLPFTPTQRNRPALLFLESVARRGEDGEFHVSAGAAAALRYRPGSERPASAPAAPAPPVPARRPAIDYARIANELRDPRAILARIEATRRPAAPRRAASTPPARPLERDLAAMWSELLRVESVGVHDNFFELGGHSLLAVQALSRVRQAWGVDLSLEVVYSGDFTVAELAKAVELKQIEQAAGSDYDALLQELEGLSDEEVRALLAREDEGNGG